jgi:hypothetical protein
MEALRDFLRVLSQLDLLKKQSRSAYNGEETCNREIAPLFHTVGVGLTGLTLMS